MKIYHKPSGNNHCHSSKITFIKTAKSTGPLFQITGSPKNVSGLLAVIILLLTLQDVNRSNIIKMAGGELCFNLLKVLVVIKMAFHGLEFN